MFKVQMGKKIKHSPYFLHVFKHNIIADLSLPAKIPEKLHDSSLRRASSVAIGKVLSGP